MFSARHFSFDAIAPTLLLTVSFSTFANTGYEAEVYALDPSEYGSIANENPVAFPTLALAKTTERSAGLSANDQAVMPISSTDSESGDDIRYNFTTSLYTKHWNPKPEHNNDQKLIGIERQNGSTSWGIALFKNSFNQDTQLVYWGKEFRLDEYVPGMRSKWMFGLMHGYKGEYKDKVPLNQLGVSPVIAPTIGYTTRYFETDIVFLGFNAITVTATLPIRF